MVSLAFVAENWMAPGLLLDVDSACFRKVDEDIDERGKYLVISIQSVGSSRKLKLDIELNSEEKEFLEEVDALPEGRLNFCTVLE